MDGGKKSNLVMKKGKKYFWNNDKVEYFVSSYFVQSVVYLFRPLPAKRVSISATIEILQS